MSPPLVPKYEFGDFRIDAVKRLLARRDGTPVPLTPRVFDTLLFLVEHHGTVLDKERLMEAVWPDAIVEENNLSQNISTLRRVFGETPGSHHFIVTVPGRGYRFVAEVTRPDHNVPPIDESGTSMEPGVAQTKAESLVAISQPSLAMRTRKRRGILIATSALLLLSFATLLFLRSRANVSASTFRITEKSIAVLPFTNLSAEQENAFFTEGVQDDILTALSKVADLKVISRTSVANYIASPHRNLREIGQELGVSQVLEGSVRRAGGKVRVTAQLIDTRTNTHVWAETYDRDLTDVFAIQSDIAQQIATALEVKLAPEEKARLGIEPTTNSEAYVLYLTALGKEATDQIAAENLYVQATVVDPTFALAHARASRLNSRIASYEEPRARREKARAQAEEALRLSPALGEAHMALGLCLYWGEKKYDAALKEFERAAAASPNNAEIYTYVGGIYRRQRRWREAVASFERALSLDPRNARIAFQSANNYLYVRDWPRAIAGFNRVLKIAVDSDAEAGLAYLEVVQIGNPAAGSKILQNIPAANDAFGVLTQGRWDLAMLERDYATAEKIVTESPFEDFSKAGGPPKAYYQGRIALARGDIESAHRYFAAAAPTFEKRLRDDPDVAERHAELALLYAYMQRKEEAVREARRAVEMEPESQNAFHGASWAANLALVFALVGEQDQAITLIERLLSTPGPIQGLDRSFNVTLAELRLRWEWDSLRSNHRFQKILAAPEPKTILPAIEKAMPAATPSL